MKILNLLKWLSSSSNRWIWIDAKLANISTNMKIQNQCFEVQRTCEALTTNRITNTHGFGTWCSSKKQSLCHESERRIREGETEFALIVRISCPRPIPQILYHFLRRTSFRPIWVAHSLPQVLYHFWHFSCSKIRRSTLVRNKSPSPKCSLEVTVDDSPYMGSLNQWCGWKKRCKCATRSYSTFLRVKFEWI